jgi:hypothetical protein
MPEDELERRTHGRHGNLMPALKQPGRDRHSQRLPQAARLAQERGLFIANPQTSCPSYARPLEARTLHCNAHRERYSVERMTITVEASATNDVAARGERQSACLPPIEPHDCAGSPARRRLRRTTNLRRAGHS